ncbi:MAG: TPM domain-containing protein [Treponema sp.]|nr:TPM domain-containing protein [Treponema sp.]
MKAKTLIKKLNINEEARSRVEQAVADAESKTTGEIAVCLAAESSDYTGWELFAAFVASFLVFIVMLPFAQNIRFFYESLTWSSPEWYLPAIYGFVVFSLVLIFFFVFNIPALDRFVIPASWRNKMVTCKAFEVFTRSGVYNTKDRSGILIYVSYIERQVRIIADTGIAKEISQDLWNLIADDLASEIGKKNTADGLCGSIEKCGALLAEKFPAEKDNPNELSDKLIILAD